VGFSTMVAVAEQGLAKAIAALKAAAKDTELLVLGLVSWWPPCGVVVRADATRRLASSSCGVRRRPGKEA
jgi:hypothetical protein